MEVWNLSSSVHIDIERVSAATVTISFLVHFRGSLYSWSCESLSLEIDRDNVLASAMNQMGRILGHALRSRSLHVTFKNEPGTCMFLL